MSNLKEIQDLVASENFKYGGNSLEILDIVAAIKDGYRLCKVDKAKEMMYKVPSSYRDFELARDETVDDCVEIIKECCE